MNIVKQLRRGLEEYVTRALSTLGLEVRRRSIRHYADATSREVELIETFERYTMTSPRRRWTLLKAVDYLDRRNIAGDIVECGVWRGGNLMLVKAFRTQAALRRRLFLYDTFGGMAEPSQFDIGSDGRHAGRIYRRRRRDGHNAWAYASLEEVRSNFQRYGLLDQDVVFVKGPVEETLRTAELPAEVALLRLDTDWYESTKVELEVLFPRLVAGGVLIVDDYGTWLGAKKAVDEYFGGHGPLLVAIDHGCRIAINV